jgi:Fibronectin type III domain
VISAAKIVENLFETYFQDEFSLDLSGLNPDSEYEVRIRAMNRQGWSQLSEPFFFTTAGTASYLSHSSLLQQEERAT